MYSSAGARTAAEREYVHAEVVAATSWDFLVFYDPHHNISVWLGWGLVGLFWFACGGRN